VQQTLDEKSSKHIDLIQQNSFDPTFLRRMLKLAKGTTKHNTF
jgi:hypothetical protein